MTGPVGAILLAAGSSSRMGADDKLTAVWRAKPLVVHAADAIAAANLPALAVVRPGASAVRAALAGRIDRIVEAADAAEGLSRSLRAGLRAAPPEWRGALICLGDMPRVVPALLTRLAAALTGDGVVVPVYAGRRGNPVGWGRAHFARLAALDGDTGGKRLLDDLAAAVTEIDSGDGSIFADIDTPADLTALGA